MTKQIQIDFQVRVGLHLFTTSILIRSCWSAPLLLLGLGVLSRLANYKDPCKRCVVAPSKSSSWKFHSRMVITKMVLWQELFDTRFSQQNIVLYDLLVSDPFWKVKLSNGLAEVNSQFYVFWVKHCIIIPTIPISMDLVTSRIMPNVNLHIHRNEWKTINWTKISIVWLGLVSPVCRCQKLHQVL